jgi:hypothetical protein
MSAGRFGINNSAKIKGTPNNAPPPHTTHTCMPASYIYKMDENENPIYITMVILYLRVWGLHLAYA